ncbi:hypothetical protein HDU83_002470 [Entophlyctis luteolus]|nr:hypothetical protein HDU83_002470 [Entophlyctis luteolus]
MDATDMPLWLKNAKTALTTSSASVAALRVRIAQELRARLKLGGKLAQHAFANMNKSDRDALFRVVSDAVLNDNTLSSKMIRPSEDDADENISGRSLWLDIREEAEAAIDEQLEVAVIAGIFKERGTFAGSDTLESKASNVARRN